MLGNPLNHVGDRNQHLLAAWSRSELVKLLGGLKHLVLILLKIVRRYENLRLLTLLDNIARHVDLVRGLLLIIVVLLISRIYHESLGRILRNLVFLSPVNNFSSTRLMSHQFILTVILILTFSQLRLLRFLSFYNK